MSLILTSYLRGVIPRHLYKNGTSSLQKCSRNINIAPLVQQSTKLPKGSGKPKYKNIIKILGIGFGIGAVASGGYLYSIYKKVDKAIPNSSGGNEYFLEEPPPKHPVARSIENPGDGSGFKITLYQFQTCPFCCKVRTFLDYYGFSYDVVEVNSVTHKQTKWTSYRKVPFLVIEQQGAERVMQLKDSSMIISALQSFISNKNQTLEEIVRGYPIFEYLDDGKKKTEITNKYFLMYGGHPTGMSKEEIVLERKWRKWVDDVYIHMLSPNVYRTMEESFQAFDWFSQVGNWEELFTTWERNLVIYVGSFAMYFIGKMLKKRHHLRDDVRASFYEETNFWLKEVKKSGGKFLGGSEPNLGDLAMYGSLMAIEGCDAFQDLTRNTKIQAWFSLMKEAVNKHQGVKYLSERGPNRK